MGMARRNRHYGRKCKRPKKKRIERVVYRAKSVKLVLVEGKPVGEVKGRCRFSLQRWMRLLFLLLLAVHWVRSVLRAVRTLTKRPQRKRRAGKLELGRRSDAVTIKLAIATLRMRRDHEKMKHNCTNTQKRDRRHGSWDLGPW